MRIRLPVGRSVLFGIAFLVALILFLPMRLGLGMFGVADEGLTARGADGTIWTGRLSEAQLGGISVGDVEAGLSPFQLLVGRARVNVSREAGGTDMLHGAVGVTRNSTGIDDLTATLPVGTRFAPLPISALGFTDFTVRFVGDACRNAEGAVRAVMSGEVAGINLAQGFTGAARCDGAALLLPLASQSGQERLDVRIDGGGGWRASVVVASTDPAVVAQLTAAGFAPGEGGYRLEIGGR